jgi:hypothetical protein
MQILRRLLAPQNDFFAALFHNLSIPALQQVPATLRRGRASALALYAKRFGIETLNWPRQAAQGS